MIDKLLTFCITRNRPHLILRMLESYYRTKRTEGEMLVYLQDDDPTIKEYIELLERNHVPYIIEPRRYLVEAGNFIATQTKPEYKYYQGVNDDHIFITSGWDKSLLQDIEIKGNGWGIAFARDIACDDNWQEHRHASAEIMSGNIVRTLGYMGLPALRHFQIDSWVRDIGEGIGRYFRNTDVIIEHRHLRIGAPMDDNYAWVYSKEQMDYGDQQYYKWRAMQMIDDIEKIKKAMTS